MKSLKTVRSFGHRAFMNMREKRSDSQGPRFNWISKNPRLRFGGLAALAVILLLGVGMPSAMRGQSTTQGGIGGTIYDASGAVVPNATVVVHNNGTNAEKSATTDASGYYLVTNLQPASYSVTVSATGFETYKDTGVVVNVGVLTTVSPHLVVGNVATTVEVAGQAAIINASTPEFAPQLNQIAISNLPINGGRWSQFVLLTPGVVSNSSGFGLVSFRAISTLLNNNTVDGADNNQAFFSEERGRTRIGYSTPKVAVQEFQVNTSNYSAEYGRSAGGVINTVTKSGSNVLHGEGYFMERNNRWGATNPFTKVFTQTSPGVFTPTLVKPKNIRLMGGFGMGGAIIKDKLFYYVAFDRYHLDYPGLAAAGTPNSFFAAPSASTLSTLATRLGVTNAEAQADYNNGLNDLLGELGTVPRTGDQDILFPKLDWTINEKNHFSISLNRMRWWSPAGIQTQTSVTFGVASFGNDYVADTWGVARLDTTFSPTLLNELRVQNGRDFEWENPQAPSAYEAQNFLTNANFPGYSNPLGLPPDVFITNGFDMGVPTFLTRPAFPDERRTQIADTVTWIHGSHTLKFGGDYSHVHEISKNLRFQFGSFSYSSLLNYFSDFYKPNSCTSGGNPAPCYTSFNQAFGPLGLEFSTNEVAFFGEDSWRLKPRLTVNLGLRYENELMPTPFSNLVNSVVPQTGRMPSYNTAFGPRVGFAYDIFGNGKTSLRGGYGIYYGRIINSTIYNALFNTGSPNGQLQYTFSGTTLAQGPLFPQILSAPPSIAAGKPSVIFFDSNFKYPQVHEMDLTIERELGWNTVLSVSYLGSLGRHMPTFMDTNIAPSTSTMTYSVVDSTGEGPLKGSTYTTPFYTARLNSSFNAMTNIESVVNSNYNALAIQVNHRFSRHVQFNAGYTWSHALDFNQNEATFSQNNSPLDAYNLKQEYANSIYNVPSRFTLNGVLDSPWHVGGWAKWLADDWRLSPILQIQSGLPYTMSTSGTLSNPPSGSTAPKVMSGGGGINASNGTFRIAAVGRNTFTMPSTAVLDLRLGKRFQIRDRYTLEFLGDAFNSLNHQNYTVASTTGYRITGSTAAPVLTYQSSFGTLTNSNSNFIYTSRQIQLGVRFIF